MAIHSNQIFTSALLVQVESSGEEKLLQGLICAKTFRDLQIGGLECSHGGFSVEGGCWLVLRVASVGLRIYWYYWFVHIIIVVLVSLSDAS